MMSDKSSNTPKTAPTTFTIGDLVRLKSGGPDMTVTYVSTMAHGVFCAASWFDDSGKRNMHEFPSECLTLVPTNAS